MRAGLPSSRPGCAVRRREWTVVVLDAHIAAAPLARDLGDTGDDREFGFAVNFDRR
jgi:hypothetical protein